MYKGQILIDIDELHRVLLKGHPAVKEGDVYITCANKENMQNMMQVISISNKLPNNFTYEVSKEMMDTPTEEWNDKMFVISFRETDIHQIELPHAINALVESEGIRAIQPPILSYVKKNDGEIKFNINKDALKDWLIDCTIINGFGKEIKMPSKMDDIMEGLIQKIGSTGVLDTERSELLYEYIKTLVHLLIKEENASNKRYILNDNEYFCEDTINLKYKIRLSDLRKRGSKIFKDIYFNMERDIAKLDVSFDNVNLDEGLRIYTFISQEDEILHLKIILPCEYIKRYEGRPSTED